MEMKDRHVKVKVKKIEQREGTIVVTRTVLGSQKTSIKKIRIRPFATATANVGVKLGRTIPTGDYGSVRIDVMVNSPCYFEEAKEMLKQCYDMADKFLTDTVGEVKDNA